MKKAHYENKNITDAEKNTYRTENEMSSQSRVCVCELLLFKLLLWKILFKYIYTGGGGSEEGIFFDQS